jgi:hypothetical protein
MNENDPEYWPAQLQEIFVAMGDRRLTPEPLKSVHMPNDKFTISHVSAREAGWKSGHYKISITGANGRSSQGDWKSFRAPPPKAN